MYGQIVRVDEGYHILHADGSTTPLDYVVGTNNITLSPGTQMVYDLNGDFVVFNANLKFTPVKEWKVVKGDGSLRVFSSPSSFYLFDEKSGRFESCPDGTFNTRARTFMFGTVPVARETQESKSMENVFYWSGGTSSPLTIITSHARTGSLGAEARLIDILAEKSVEGISFEHFSSRSTDTMANNYAQAFVFVLIALLVILFIFEMIRKYR